MTAEGSISITWKLDDNAESWAFPWAYLINPLAGGGEGGGRGVGRRGGPSCLCTHEYVCACVYLCVSTCVLTGPLGDSDACYCLESTGLSRTSRIGVPVIPLLPPRGREGEPCMVRAAACSSSALESTALPVLCLPSL